MRLSLSFLPCLSPLMHTHTWMVRIVGKVPDSFLSKKVLFLSDLGQSTLVVEDQLLGKRGGSVWDGRGGVEEEG